MHYSVYVIIYCTCRGEPYPELSQGLFNHTIYYTRIIAHLQEEKEVFECTMLCLA